MRSPYLKLLVTYLRVDSYDTLLTFRVETWAIRLLKEPLIELLLAIPLIRVNRFVRVEAYTATVLLNYSEMLYCPKYPLVPQKLFIKAA